MRLPLSVILLTVASFAYAQPLVNVQTVRVGDAGNAPDSSTGLGAVAYDYKIGKYKLTVGQYCIFLNAVAATNTNAYVLALWQYGYGIDRSGFGNSTDPYRYSVAADWSSNKPIVLSWFHAARFANWLHNGATNGASTETGAYMLNGVTNGIIAKTVAAKWWIPSENEWFKAAFYKSGGTNEGYWSYATRSDSLPGNVVGGMTNQANYRRDGVFAVTQSTNFPPFNEALTDVGAFSASSGPYGTFDQGGNFFEWHDKIDPPYQGIRGGSYYVGGEWLYKTAASVSEPHTGLATVRLATDTSPVDSDGDGLSDDWELGYGRYEIINDAFRTWEAAKADAEARGGQLATITSSTEQANIIAILGGAANLNGWAYWIGAKFTSGAWGWINGETWSYTDWRGGNGGGGPEPYGVLFGTAQNTGYEDLILHWGDLSDFYQAFYILERGFPTDPYNPDTDGDGLSDKVESGSGVFLGALDTGSNPLEMDSNGDGFTDGETASRSIDPNLNLSKVLQMTKDLTISQPGRFDLFARGSIMDMSLGGVMIEKQGNFANVVFQPQTTTDLATLPFTNNGTPITNQILMPENKGFIRIRAVPNPTP